MTQEDLTQESVQQFIDTYDVLSERIDCISNRLYGHYPDDWKIENDMVEVHRSDYYCGSWEHDYDRFPVSYLWDDDYLTKHLEAERIRKEKKEKEKQEKLKREEEERRIQKERSDRETYERLKKQFENK